MTSILLQQLRSARLPPVSAAGDLTVPGLLDAVILPAAQQVVSASVRCDLWLPPRLTIMQATLHACSEPV